MRGGLWLGAEEFHVRGRALAGFRSNSLHVKSRGFVGCGLFFLAFGEDFDDELGSGFYVEEGGEAADVVADGVGGDAEFFRDLFVGFALAQQVEDFLLGFCECDAFSEAFFCEEAAEVFAAGGAAVSFFVGVAGVDVAEEGFSVFFPEEHGGPLSFGEDEAALGRGGEAVAAEDDAGVFFEGLDEVGFFADEEGKGDAFLSAFFEEGARFGRALEEFSAADSDP